MNFATNDFLTLAIGLVCVVVAVYFWNRSQYWRSVSGLPEGTIIYDDMGDWQKNYDALFSADLMLTGKPDYLVYQNDGYIIPVEIKSTPAPTDPYEGHVMQLAAYCALVEAEHGIRPSHGIIQYEGGAFSIDYSYELEDQLMFTLNQMREDEYAIEVYRDHNSRAKCHGCGFRDICEQRLI